MKSNLDLQTRCIHAGQQPDPATGAIMTPVYLSSTFVQESPGHHKGFEYTRTANPTRSALEACIADLESGTRGFALSSGCAATQLVLSLLKAGDHVIASDDLYGGTYRLMSQIVSKWGIDFSFVDLTQTVNLEKAIRPETKLVWIETPSNPTLKLINILATSQLCKKHSLMLAVDNTFATPIFQRPLDLGADIVVHSATKYLGGHSDLLAGIIVVRSETLGQSLHFNINSIGPVLDPFHSFLLLRSIKTLPIRMKAHADNAQKLAEFLEQHPKVERVIYPGLASHPQKALADSQMSGFSGMISIELKTDLSGAKRFLENLKIFSLAESLGGVESLIEHPAIMTHASVPADIRKTLGITDGFVRLSVGIESCVDLERDLAHGLSQI